MLNIKNLDKYFYKGRKNEIHVINHTTLSLNEHGLVALLGPSGCGKTTLLNVIGGLDTIKKGTIHINGEKISSKRISKVDKIRALNVGYIFQDYKLLENLTVFENVAIVLKMMGLKDKSEIKEKVEYVLDCVGMLRYQKRPAGMLSGGERQRVGIARALVKDPNIILADEPTGNLDSKNTIEIMKIIKEISKKRLVILVTHEQELAKYYANRIIEIEDGTIIQDRENEKGEDFDFELENCFYLNDFKEKHQIQEKGINLSIYQEKKEDISLNIVVKNGNIYIQSKTSQKIEVVDEESNIEMIEDNFSNVKKETLESYHYHFEKIHIPHQNKKYTSIISFPKMILGGFQKVFSFPILKKILLLGFFLAGIFIMYSISSLKASLTLREEEFVLTNPNYLTVESNGFKEEEYLEYEKLDEILYLLPGNSLITLNVPFHDYYQTTYGNGTLTASLVSMEFIKEDMLTLGKMPQNEKEVIIDELAIKKMLNQNDNFQMVGILKIEDMLNRTLETSSGLSYKIVGMTSQKNPSIYIDKNQFITILSSSNNKENTNYQDILIDTSTSNNIAQYSFYQDKIELIKGHIPTHDYEVIINTNLEENMPIGKEIEIKVGDKKLKVVGYYTSKYGISNYLVNDTTIKYQLINQTKTLTIYPKESEKVINYFQEKKFSIYNTYQKNKENYIKTKQEEIQSTILVSGIILAISFIEIFLMIRSSFLSRMKEIGIYRAIGIKKRDIYKMFIGEIFAITTIAGIPGLLFIAYILDILSGISYLSYFIFIDIKIVLLSCLLLYGFNLIIGLIPVYHTLRKRPAEILSRYDID